MHNKIKYLMHDDKDWLELLDALEGMDDDYDNYSPYGGYIPELPPGKGLTHGPENDKPYITQGEVWRKEGKCPQCGKDGYFSHFQLVCAEHGPY